MKNQPQTNPKANLITAEVEPFDGVTAPAIAWGFLAGGAIAALGAGIYIYLYSQGRVERTG